MSKCIFCAIADGEADARIVAETSEAPRASNRSSAERSSANHSSGQSPREDGEVAETNDAIAFLDANPLAPGHTLVIPKDHHETLGDLPPEAGEAVFSLLHELVPVIEEAVDADASTVAFNNGRAAGQEVDHVHGHIVPRFEGDGGGPIHGVVGSRPDLNESAMDDIAARIAGRVDE
ncbi:HIT family protein [Halanaeroarchaeum sp. HSR-CO]|uniref:HIT family protein n=1 Tax=Halanaeroarchaeum sp. HSR-CO TaxID=2866382 RepID=UPI00217CD217|nr:HIT family protein [Halanaeroarchaeum sp. HSR-CO]